MVRVFISHSTKDIAFVTELGRILQWSNTEAIIAGEYPQPSEQLQMKVANQIERCDCVIAFLTVDGARSEWVNRELGFAKRAGKLIVPIVEEGVQPKGFLASIEYIPFHRENPYDGILRAKEFLRLYKARRDEAANAAAAIGILMLLFGLMTLLYTARGKGKT